MQTFLKGKRVGYWLSEKKIRKLNFQAFAELCRKRGVEVVQLFLTFTAAFSAGVARTGGQREGRDALNRWQT
ncbi:hypothetical protein BTVI_93325 [Pitangus sulphuratus]|nr:hypothetical protein BTVI_93325 [Pitangus sulphuratus]